MLTVHALLVASACWAAFARGRWSLPAAWIALAGWSLVWFGVNHRWEGRILRQISQSHGLTEADLVVPALIAVVLAVRAVRLIARHLIAGRLPSRHRATPGPRP